jgi:hypothetical protein
MGKDGVLIVALSTELDKNKRPYLSVTDGFGARWNLFGELANTKLEIGKGYEFQYDLNGEYKNVKKIEKLDNIFKQVALKELANRSDFTKNMGISTSYAIELCKADKIKLEELFTWSERINKFIQNFADNEMAKINPDNKEIK